LHIDRTVAGEVHVFAPAGRLGTLSSGDLIEALVGAIKDGVRLLLVDLAGVDYISSAGLLALDAVSGRVQAVSGELVLCRLVEPVRLAFDLAGLLPHFVIAPSRDLALARFAAGNTSRSHSD
jgi:anti-anti-sigma factor